MNECSLEVQGALCAGILLEENLIFRLSVSPSYIVTSIMSSLFRGKLQLDPHFLYLKNFLKKIVCIYYLFGCIVVVEALGIFLAPCGIFCCTADSLVVACGLNSCGVSLVALRHVGSQFPDQGSNPHPLRARLIFNHWTARKVPDPPFLYLPA